MLEYIEIKGVSSANVTFDNLKLQQLLDDNPTESGSMSMFFQALTDTTLTLTGKNTIDLQGDANNGTFCSYNSACLSFAGSGSLAIVNASYAFDIVDGTYKLNGAAITLNDTPVTAP